MDGTRCLDQSHQPDCGICSPAPEEVDIGSYKLIQGEKGKGNGLKLLRRQITSTRPISGSSKRWLRRKLWRARPAPPQSAKAPAEARHAEALGGSGGADEAPSGSGGTSLAVVAPRVNYSLQPNISAMAVPEHALPGSLANAYIAAQTVASVFTPHYDSHLRFSADKFPEIIDGSHSPEAKRKAMDSLETLRSEVGFALDLYDQRSFSRLEARIDLLKKAMNTCDPALLSEPTWKVVAMQKAMCWADPVMDAVREGKDLAEEIASLSTSPAIHEMASATVKWNEAVNFELAKECLPLPYLAYLSAGVLVLESLDKYRENYCKREIMIPENVVVDVEEILPGGPSDPGGGRRGAGGGTWSRMRQA